MTWIDLAVATAVASALLVLPGLPVALISGLRGSWLLGASVPLSVTTISVAALVTPRLGLSWSILAVLVTALAATAAAWGARLLLRRGWTTPDTDPLSSGDSRPRLVELATLAAATVGTLVLGFRLLRAANGPEHYSQTYDGVFHLSAVRWILDTADASPLTIAQVGDGGGFYPAGFHGVAALVAQLTSASVPGAVNATWLAFAAVVWPLAIVLLTRAMVGARPVALLAAGALSSGIAAFPMLLVDYGVLYPLLAGYAVLPIVLALGIRALGLSAEGAVARAPALLLVIAALPGLALLHPTTAITWLVLITPPVLVALWREGRRGGRGLLALPAGGLWVAGVAGTAFVLRPSFSGAAWQPYLSAPGALREVVTLSAYQGPIAFIEVYRGAVPVVALIALWIGAVVAIGRRPSARTVLLLAGPAIIAALFVVATSFDHTPLRHAITGVWYSNAPRIASLLPMVTIPVAALGVAWLADRVAGLPRVGPWVMASTSRAATVAIIATLALTAALQGDNVRQAYADIAAVFSVTVDSPLVTPDEAELIDQLDDLVPEDVTVAGSPWTGTTMAYAVADRPVLYPHLSARASEDVAAVALGLRDAAPGSSVCAAIDRLDVGFVLDFGTQEVQYFDNHRYPGLENLETSNAVELVATEGTARLYEVTGCG